MDNNKCIGRIKFFRTDYSHDFYNIYDTEHHEFVPSGVNFQYSSVQEIAAWKTIEKKSVYVKSVCRYCGKEIMRNQ